jgi:hypothetical protein
LGILRKWAESRVATGNEPPWAWYQYMKLIETVAAIQTGRAAVASTPAGALPSGGAARGLEDDGVSNIDKRRRRRRDDEPPLPL